MKKVENACYFEEQVKIKFDKHTGDTFYVKMGYIPESRLYIAVSTSNPYFCFSGNTFEEAKEKARKSLEFYVQHGLQEQ